MNPMYTHLFSDFIPIKVMHISYCPCWCVLSFYNYIARLQTSSPEEFVNNTSSRIMSIIIIVNDSNCMKVYTIICKHKLRLFYVSSFLTTFIIIIRDHCRRKGTSFIRNSRLMYPRSNTRNL